MSHVRLAGSGDIAELVRLRELLFRDLAAGWGPPPSEVSWKDRCADALAGLLTSDEMRIVVIDGTTGLAACGMGAVDRRLPTPYNPSGLVGHVFGIVTDPAYRKRGHARAIVEDLLAWFDGRGLKRVDLNASPEGHGLYRSLGFDDHPDPVLSRKS
ncbi:GNAT family N-acetyltransferase [Rhizohabitans arisaemae]|uniref:GNAT family N-acetyltransferase n=1 Tax=Rhizohabitans arisaemae TaxID=2720610 RepID=UPI0024B11847|nr:GNAT family N-acetyltransferase [Rhizohabitans arisaemae]